MMLKDKSPASLDDFSRKDSSPSAFWFDQDRTPPAPRLDGSVIGRSSVMTSDGGSDLYSFSDTEGGLVPLRNRLKGFLGSFGKGSLRKRKTQNNDGHSPLTVSKSEFYAGERDAASGHYYLSQARSNPLSTFGELTKQIESLSSSSNQDEQQPRPRVSKADSNDYASTVGGSNRESTTVSDDNDDDDDSMTSENDLSEEESNNNKNKNNNNHNNSSSLSRISADNSRKVYFIAREIMTSERVFVDILKLLNVEFREFVQKARRESRSTIITDPDLSRVFSNLPELQALNEDLLQDFEDRIEHWESIQKIADVIVRKGPFLKLYTAYIREFSAVNSHLDECCSKYPKFGKLVKEFEKGARCRNLKLKHFLLKPVQRLPQYKLLLEDYLKNITNGSPDFRDTTDALRIVSEAAEHANDTIKQGVRLLKTMMLGKSLMLFFSLFRTSFKKCSSCNPGWETRN